MEAIVETYFIDEDIPKETLREYLKNKSVTINQSKKFMENYINPYIENKLIYITYDGLPVLKVMYGGAIIRLTELGVDYMENIRIMNYL